MNDTAILCEKAKELRAPTLKMPEAYKMRLRKLRSLNNYRRLICTDGLIEDKNPLFFYVGLTRFKT
jgi:hypothetical protein